MRDIYLAWSIGLNAFDFLFHKKRNGGVFSTKFKNKRVYYTHRFWFLFSIKEIFVEQSYKFQTFSDAPRIIDCGSNIGLSSIYFLQNYPNCKVTCFEPDDEIVEIFKKNISAFGFEAEILNKAVWIENGDLFFASDGQLGGKINEKRGRRVECTRLKDYIIEKIDFLKIDIEGAELMVLQDCKDRLHHVDNIFIEYHCMPNESQRLDEILSILSSAGLRYYIKEAWINRARPYLEKDLASTMYELQLNIFGYRKS